MDSSHPQTGYGFAPTIDRFFGVGGVEPMARGHMGICLHLGITKEQLSALLDMVENYLGASSARPLRKVLKSLNSQEEDTQGHWR